MRIRGFPWGSCDPHGSGLVAGGVAGGAIGGAVRDGHCSLRGGCAMRTSAKYPEQRLRETQSQKRTLSISAVLNQYTPTTKNVKTFPQGEWLWKFRLFNYLNHLTINHKAVVFVNVNWWDVFCWLGDEHDLIVGFIPDIFFDVCHVINDR